MVEIMVYCLNVIHKECSIAFITNDVPQAVKHVRGNAFIDYMQPLRRQHAENTMNWVGKW